MLKYLQENHKLLEQLVAIRKRRINSHVRSKRTKEERQRRRIELGDVIIMEYVDI